MKALQIVLKVEISKKLNMVIRQMPCKKLKIVSVKGPNF